MPPSLQVHPRLVTLVRWVAHVLSVLILFFFAVMMGGEVMQGQTPRSRVCCDSPVPGSSDP